MLECNRQYAAGSICWCHECTVIKPGIVQALCVNTRHVIVFARERIYSVIHSNPTWRLTFATHKHLLCGRCNLKWVWERLGESLFLSLLFVDCWVLCVLREMAHMTRRGGGSASEAAFCIRKGSAFPFFAFSITREKSRLREGCVTRVGQYEHKYCEKWLHFGYLPFLLQ